MQNFYVIVPIMNESGNIERLFGGFKQFNERFSARYDVHFIVVDDGSTDDTLAQIENHRGNLDLTVLPHAVNQGPGGAFATAFGHLATISLQADDWVVTMEGDNTSRIELIETMLRRAIEEDYSVVLASPYMYGGGVINTTSLRVLLSKVANLFVKEFLGIHGIVTASSFFRLYRGEAILHLQQFYGAGIVERKGFECMVEMLIKMIRLDFTISEVPMVLDTSLRAGKSKMRIGRTIRGYVALFSRLRAWHVASQKEQKKTYV